MTTMQHRRLIRTLHSCLKPWEKMGYLLNRVLCSQVKPKTNGTWFAPYRYATRISVLVLIEECVFLYTKCVSNRPRTERNQIRRFKMVIAYTWYASSDALHCSQLPIPIPLTIVRSAPVSYPYH